MKNIDGLKVSRATTQVRAEIGVVLREGSKGESGWMAWIRRG